VNADTKHIGILLFDDVEELDAVGPYEVLAFWTQNFPEDGYAVSCISADGGSVVGAKGMTLGAHTSVAEAPPLDIFLHPGGIGTRPLLRDADHVAFVRRLRETVPLMTSVCTGALVYAAAGMLSNRPATTHWGAFGELADIDSTVELIPDARYVDDGDVITSAGVSAGIDMALHLVARLSSPERAEQTRRGIQYEPPEASSTGA
jgi:transcriptional regulator GlxA family with amidase domain